MKISSYGTFILLFPIVLWGVATSSAQDSGNGGKDGTSIRFLALGHQPAIKFEASQKDEISYAPGAPGEPPQKVVIPKGSPVEVVPKDFERLPSSLAIESKNRNDGPVDLGLTLNSVTREIMIPTREKVAILRRKDGGNGEAPTYVPYLSADLTGDSSSKLVVMVAQAGTEPAWEKPAVVVFDTSPAALSPGSLFFYNSTPFAIELHLPLKDPIIVESRSSTVVRPGINKDGRTKAVVKLVSRKSEVKRQFFHNTLPLPADGRCYMFAYFDPTANTASPAGIVQFTDVVKAPPAGDGNR